MAVLHQRGSDDPACYDLSFMYTKRCDLSCAFCMYESGPDVDDAIDLNLLKTWLDTVDMDRIASFGAYGGEVAVDLDGFGKCFDLVADMHRPHFVITNGTWSTDTERAIAFLKFCERYHCHIVVSGTPWHRRHQNRELLEALKAAEPGAITLKPKDENFHAMGRLDGKMRFSCTQKCMSWNRALRIAVQPDGTIIFQNCDGIYPVVGTLAEPFVQIDARIQALRANGFADACPHYQPSEGNRPMSDTDTPAPNKQRKMHPIIRRIIVNPFTHNFIGHPVMAVQHALGFVEAGNRFHDLTCPYKKPNTPTQPKCHALDDIAKTRHGEDLEHCPKCGASMTNFAQDEGVTHYACGATIHDDVWEQPCTGSTVH